MAGKSEIVAELAAATDLSRKKAAETVDAVFAEITSRLRRGERVQIPGFGAFSVSRRAARKGRNPATGSTITIKDARRVRFKAAKRLRARKENALEYFVRTYDKL